MQQHGGFTRWSVLNHIQAPKIHQWRNENIEREKNDETCKMNSLNKLIILCSLYSENRDGKRNQKITNLLSNTNGTRGVDL